MINAQIIVFYDNQVLTEFSEFIGFHSWRRSCLCGCPEFYNGAHVYMAANSDRRWYRMDLTPVLLEDVPPALRAWVLIL